tara:strand:- start:2962 stop:3318 length:357 start_codon:yes stop_codon:yes gene_type:complete
MRFAGELSTAEHGTLHLVRRMAKLRRCHQALNSGRLERIHVGRDTASYKRVSDAGDQVFVRLTRSRFESAPNTLPQGYINVMEQPVADVSRQQEDEGIASPKNIEIWIKDRHPCMDEI